MGPGGNQHKLYFVMMSDVLLTQRTADCSQTLIELRRFHGPITHKTHPDVL